MKAERLLDAPWWVASWVPRVDNERSIVWFRRAIWAVFLSGLLAFVVRGADQPADPFLPSQQVDQVDPAGGP